MQTIDETITPMAYRVKQHLTRFESPRNLPERILYALIESQIVEICRYEYTRFEQTDYMRRLFIDQQIDPLRARAESYLYAIEVYRDNA